jgi:molybdate transport system substrate-binding protein
MWINRVAIIALSIYCLCILSCLNTERQNTTPDGDSNTNLIILAASSLTDAFTEMKGMFEKSYPQVQVLLNFAGTPTLLTQLTLSTNADLFAPADEHHMNLAQTYGVISTDSTTKFATNKLTIITPASNARVKQISDIGNPNTKIVLALTNVPLGQYSRTSLELMSELEISRPDFTHNVLANVVSQETAARQVLAKIIIGEADAGIVYITDAAKQNPNKLNMIPIPDKANVTATYSIGIVADRQSQKQSIAQQFIDFVVSDEGQDILRRHGFGKVQQNQ